MCEFCQSHGEGKKWYLNVKNYSHDLLSDLNRKKFIEHFYSEAMGEGLEKLTRRERIFAKKKKMPANLVTQFVDASKQTHFGQVVPIEDVKKIFSMCSSISRIACGCRWATQKKEERCCFGITIDPARWYESCDTGYFGKPDLAHYELLTEGAAMEAIASFDRQGLMHSVWTFMTPFVGAICNCDTTGCMAMRHTRGLNMQALFRAEYIAEIDSQLCTGCGACEALCPVKAISVISAGKRAIDKTGCYGCGVCRSVCQAVAIRLKDRSSDPAACNIW